MRRRGQGHSPRSGNRNGPVRKPFSGRAETSSLDGREYRMSLTGKVVLVTGGAGGLGEATVRQLKEAGASVVIADIAVDKGKALADELGGSVAYVHTDVLDDGSVDAALDTAGQLGEFRYAVIAHGGFRSEERRVG